MDGYICGRLVFISCGIDEAPDRFIVECYESVSKKYVGSVSVVDGIYIIENLDLYYEYDLILCDLQHEFEKKVLSNRKCFEDVVAIIDGTLVSNSILLNWKPIAYITNSKFENTIDERGIVTWDVNGDVVFDSNGANFRTIDGYMQTSSGIDFNSDYIVEFDILFKTFSKPFAGAEGAIEVFSNANTAQVPSSRFFGISVVLDGNYWNGVDRSLYFGVSNVWAEHTTMQLQVNKTHRIKLVRQDSEIKFYVDDVVIGTRQNVADITNTDVIRLGSTLRNTYSNYVINNLRIQQYNG